MLDFIVMENNLTAKVFLIVSIVFVTTTLVVWVYVFNNISVQNILYTSIRNIESKFHTPINKNNKSAYLISDDRYIQNYYLIPNQSR